MRGAPAIAIAAALALAVELRNRRTPFASAEGARRHIDAQLQHLVTRCALQAGPKQPQGAVMQHTCLHLLHQH